MVSKEQGCRGIAQLVVSKVEKIEWSEKKKIKLNTNRNKSGFGSTGF